ncbi:tripartite tricarboxylate transporter substrate binding protein [Roseococcus sp. SDR]|uniref:Bug family tripartite tricarboxylate transporter substrate binding protein n=1 Tax=Roseococcus sp. SDR TaxID=2835532 RepID=UPI001BCE599E|nr:tripartite tricarboxylate transporter substrate binding protein [Roseococcus sp. SDR]MBS7788542.1 tripartite tricarboxylate transporter substrate binding protein [Roseococcus sp. SDR]MBV1843856.1 tripartite tricarboxylate transporter substrate binding protein [Roseococcus sp. SDR]
MIPRRALLLTPLATPATMREAGAQSWPTRPVTLIVPFAPGGNVDTVARLAAAELSRRLGQSVVVENAPGAGGTIGTERVARAAPDGYTLLVGVESPFTISPFVTPNAVRYEPLRDFAPIGMLASLPLTLVGRPDLPANDLPSLLALARSRPDGLTFATSGNGTSLHLWGEIIARGAGVKLEHVPYRIAAQIPTDLIAGRLDLAVLTITTTAPLLREGRIKGFANSSLSAIDGLPPLASLPAFQGLEMLAWQGIFAPARTDAAIIARLAAALDAMQAEPEFRQRLGQIGMTPWRKTPAEMTALLQAELARYQEVVRAANIRSD